MNDALTVFEQEHQHALAELDKIERAALALQAGTMDEPTMAALRAGHAFLSTAVRTHNENEERALFPVLGDEAPTEIFVEEHVRLRELERELLQALDHDPSIATAPAMAIVDLLRMHITREDQVLFPMSRALLGPEGLAEVGRRLDAIAS